VIDHLLERGARSPAFFVEKSGNIVIEGKSGSHIMMLHMETS
jgi:hypothetical protein